MNTLIYCGSILSTNSVSSNIISVSLSQSANRLNKDQPQASL
jgi:hypothetical protein